MVEMTDAVALSVIAHVLDRGLVNRDAEPPTIPGTSIRCWIDIYLDEDYEHAALVRVTDAAFCGEDEVFLFMASWNPKHVWVGAGVSRPFKTPWRRRRNEARVDFMQWIRDYPSPDSRV